MIAVLKGNAWLLQPMLCGAIAASVGPSGQATAQSALRGIDSVVVMVNLTGHNQWQPRGGILSESGLRRKIELHLRRDGVVVLPPPERGDYLVLPAVNVDLAVGPGAGSSLYRVRLSIHWWATLQDRSGSDLVSLWSNDIFGLARNEDAERTIEGAVVDVLDSFSNALLAANQ